MAKLKFRVFNNILSVAFRVASCKPPKSTSVSLLQIPKTRDHASRDRKTCIDRAKTLGFIRHEALIRRLIYLSSASRESQFHTY